MLDPDQPTVRAIDDCPGLIFAYRFRDGACRAAPEATISVAPCMNRAAGSGSTSRSPTPNARDMDRAMRADPATRARRSSCPMTIISLLEPVEGGVAGVFADLLREFEGESRDLGRLRFALTDELVVSGRRDALGAIARTREAIDARQAAFPTRSPCWRQSSDISPMPLARSGRGAHGDARPDRGARDRQRHARRAAPARAGSAHGRAPAPAARHRCACCSGAGLRQRGPNCRRVSAKRPAVLAQRLDGLDHEIAAIQDRARLLQDEIAARLAAETNRYLFVLSLATVILLPPTLVAGVFGMNVTDLPFTKDPGGFGVGDRPDLAAPQPWSMP